MAQRPIKLNPRQLRSIITEELRRVHEGSAEYEKAINALSDYEGGDDAPVKKVQGRFVATFVDGQKHVWRPETEMWDDYFGDIKSLSGARKMESDDALDETDEFKLTDVSQTVMDDPDVSDAASALIEQLAHFADKLAKKEELVPTEGDAFYDTCLEVADEHVRDAIYAYIERMLQRATGY